MEAAKSTITKMAKIIEPYINADEIKRTNLCTDILAAPSILIIFTNVLLIAGSGIMVQTIEPL
ncbi:MAG: hypothetical protein VB031_09410 [Eubacteriaceae bacterium]|nr:hypothetical protein [Eubacteriaceae bacterium]